MAVVHRFDPPDRFVVGTVGEPGSRTFFLQVRQGRRLLSVALEKQQVAVLAERMDQLLDQLLAESSGATIPALPPAGSEDAQPLDQPIDEEFRAGTITLSWDPDDGRVVIEVFPFSEATAVPADLDLEVLAAELDDEEPEEVIVVSLEPGPARAFVARAEKVVNAGRPSCPFCGEPVSTEGHLCVRANGFRRRPS